MNWHILFDTINLTFRCPPVHKKQESHQPRHTQCWKYDVPFHGWPSTRTSPSVVHPRWCCTYLFFFHAVDGSKIRLTSWYGKYPIVYRVSYTPGGDFFHQQYVFLRKLGVHKIVIIFKQLSLSMIIYRSIVAVRLTKGSFIKPIQQKQS